MVVIIIIDAVLPSGDGGSNAIQTIGYGSCPRFSLYVAWDG